MTAVIGGSNRFVPAVLLGSEVQEMYPQYLGIDPSKKANDPLATYARLEYGTSDATWLLVGLRNARTPRVGRVRRWVDAVRKDRDAVRTSRDVPIGRDLAAGVTE